MWALSGARYRCVPGVVLNFMTFLWRVSARVVGRVVV